MGVTRARWRARGALCIGRRAPPLQRRPAPRRVLPKAAPGPLAQPPHPFPLPAAAAAFAAGVRKEFDVNGLQVLMFWYRNQPYAIEARSPAEGAYAEGFIKAKFTQVGCGEQDRGVFGRVGG